MIGRLPAAVAPPSDAASAVLPDVTLRTPPNWTAVGFFAGLGMLHLWNGIPSLYYHRMEGLYSLTFGTFFICLSLAGCVVARELTILRRERRIRLRSGFRQLCLERSIPFNDIHGVRVTQMRGRSPDAMRVEVLCDNEDLECPPSRFARQEALYLALAMNVQLIKVYDEEPAGPAPAGADRDRGDEAR